jgi:hypothetical protein
MDLLIQVQISCLSLVSVVEDSFQNDNPDKRLGICVGNKSDNNVIKIKTVHPLEYSMDGDNLTIDFTQLSQKIQVYDGTDGYQNRMIGWYITGNTMNQFTPQIYSQIMETTLIDYPILLTFDVNINSLSPILAYSIHPVGLGSISGLIIQPIDCCLNISFPELRLLQSLFPGFLDTDPAKESSEPHRDKKAVKLLTEITEEAKSMGIYNEKMSTIISRIDKDRSIHLKLRGSE